MHVANTAKHNLNPISEDCTGRNNYYFNYFSLPGVLIRIEYKIELIYYYHIYRIETNQGKGICGFRSDDPSGPL